MRINFDSAETATARISEDARQPDWIVKTEKVLGAILNAICAFLVLAEIVLISASVASRYLLHRPLIWSDELASLLLIWLVMVGASNAYLRSEHMRVTTFMQKVPVVWQQRIGVFVDTACLALLLALFLPTLHHVEIQIPVEFANLGLSDSTRVAALTVGVSIMSFIAVLKLLTTCSLKSFVLSAVILLAVIGLLALARPLLQDIGNFNLVVFFIVILGACVVLAFPIAFCFGISTFLYIGMMTKAPISVVVGRMDEGVSHIVLLSIPMFVFLGLLIEITGIAKALVNCMATLIGHLRGGMNYVLILSMYLVSGISGAKAADMAAIAPGLMPEMRRRGSDPDELAALLSATGAQTETIPPSMVLIMIGSVAGVSINALFIGGLLPAAVCGLSLIAITAFKARYEVQQPVKRASAAQMLKAVLVALPALSLPLIIRAAVTEGIATATEVAAIGVLYSLVVGILIYRQFDWRRIYPMLVVTASLSGAILIILGFASATAWALTQSGFSRQIVQTMIAMPGGSFGFMLVSIVAFVLLGSILEGIPAILVFGPLLFPVARELGIHEVHYAMVIIIAMGIGLFAPPFGVGYYTACAISGVSSDGPMKKIWPYLLTLLVSLIVIAAVPWISIGFL